MCIRDRICIFDDCFSAVDFKTDAKLRAALARETKNKSVLIVAQRISTIMSADKIIVLDEGKIVGQGKHKELMTNCSVYREIALSQLSENELKGADKPSNAKKTEIELTTGEAV
jgi:ATP-binding cassette subfamily B protein